MFVYSYNFLSMVKTYGPKISTLKKKLPIENISIKSNSTRCSKFLNFDMYKPKRMLHVFDSREVSLFTHFHK